MAIEGNRFPDSGKLLLLFLLLGVQVAHGFAAAELHAAAIVERAMHLTHILSPTLQTSSTLSMRRSASSLMWRHRGREDFDERAELLDAGDGAFINLAFLGLPG